jgi:hypothetical protein
MQHLRYYRNRLAMALTPNEADDAFRGLVSALRDRGFGWVITQVEEKLALGKVRTKKLRTREIPEHENELWELRETADLERRRGALFAVAEPYTPQERLNILLDSVILASPRVFEIAHDSLSALREFGVAGRIDFEPEGEVNEPFSLVAEEIGGHGEASRHLIRLIEELRGELLANSPQLTR